MSHQVVIAAQQINQYCADGRQNLSLSYAARIAKPNTASHLMLLFWCLVHGYKRENERNGSQVGEYQIDITGRKTERATVRIAWTTVLRKFVAPRIIVYH